MTALLVSSPQTRVVGERPMIDFALWTAVHARFRQGQGKRKLARELGLDRKTVKRMLAQERPAPYRRTVSRPPVLTPALEVMHRRAAAVDDTADRSFHELPAQGYPGGDAMVKLAGRPLRMERDRLAEATRRFDTAPGRPAQVDWGTTWAEIGGPRVRVQVVVMVLGYSRRLDVECTMDQPVATLVAGHQQALDWFGGLTEERLYDNPTTVVRTRDWEGRASEWHPQVGDVARDDGFTPRRGRPDRAQTNGTVESGVTSVKRRFVLGRPLPSWEALNPMAPAGVMRLADQRIHGTTVRKPAAAFAEAHRRSHLGPPPDVLQASVLRTVARDCLVTVETNRDSVPAADGGQDVAGQWGAGATVQISHQGTLIATHRRAHGHHQRCVAPSPAARRRRPAPPPGTPQSAEPVHPTRWTGALPAVTVRALAVDEALLGQAVRHDYSPAPPAAGPSWPPPTLDGAGAARDPSPRRQGPGGHRCGLPGPAAQ